VNGKLDVEVHDGRVIAVWFGCQLLPFEQLDIGEERAVEFGEATNPDGRITQTRILVEYE
jgi:hypothetical protein